MTDNHSKPPSMPKPNMTPIREGGRDSTPNPHFWDVVITLFIMLTILALLLALIQSLAAASARAPLPITYLGEGVATYEAGPGQSFIVKRHPFRFHVIDQPTYHAADKERVWLATGADVDPPALYKQTTFVGMVDPGCEISYTILDDDLDGRKNRFELDGAAVHQTAEGMVVTGRFLSPGAGSMVFIAEDSVAAYLAVCERSVTLTPSATPAPTETATPTMTPTATITPTAVLTPTATLTPTVALTASPTATGTITPTVQPSITPTAVIPPTATPVGGPGEATATPTITTTPKPPRLDACFWINFEVANTTARRGWYWIQEDSGRLLALLFLEEGWDGSAPVEVDITFAAVHVRVFYAPTLAGERVELPILNHAPGLKAGWVARGICHAIEVDWPY